MDIQKIFESIDSMKDHSLNFLKDITEIESPSDFKEGVDKVGNYVIEKAKALGWDVKVREEEKSGNAICITMNKDSKEKPIVFSAHMDTVHPVGSFGKENVTIDGNVIHGPGVHDCKGGIVVSFVAMEALRKAGYDKRPIKLLLQSDEEVSSIYSNKDTVKFMCDETKDAICFLNAEPGPKEINKITIERKGILRYKLTVHGFAVHSGSCYNGKSAVLEAAYKIIELEKIKEKGGLTYNCGVIHGGTVGNVVPDNCEVIVDIRFKTMEEMHSAEERIKEIAAKSYVEGTTCDVSLVSERPPMELIDGSVELLKKYEKICEKYGLEKPVQNIGVGGSDSAYMTAIGIPSLDCLGPFGMYSHNTKELVFIDSLTVKAKHLVALAIEL